jgi:hypothetical protein
MSNLLSLTSGQLKRAADIKDRIASLEKALAAILGSSAPATKSVKPAKKKGQISARRETRPRIEFVRPAFDGHEDSKNHSADSAGKRAVRRRRHLGEH